MKIKKTTTNRRRLRMNPVAKVRGSHQDPVLLPPRDEPYVLRGVYERVADGCREEVVLDCGDSSLQIRVDQDLDALVCHYDDAKHKRSKGFRSIGDACPWNQWMGKECGWTWVAVNQQGYFDTVLLSFDGIIPNVMLHAVASSIRIVAIPMIVDVNDVLS